MPITFKLDTTQGILFEYWRGPITISEVAAYWTALAAGEEVKTSIGSIADVRDCEPKFTGEEFRVLARQILIAVHQGAKRKVAVIVSDPVQYGMSRQHQLFSESFMNVEVFYSEVMALKYVLGNDPGTGI
jgi:hypothetical protein